jgi:hypothetical protein
METVFLQPPLLRYLLIDRIGSYVSWEIFVECAIEKCDGFRVREGPDS